MPLIRHQYLRQLPVLLAVAAVVATLVVAVPRILPVTAMMENWVADFRVASLTPEEPQHPVIVILEITEDTLATLPYRSPVDRAFLAVILEKLAGAGVRAVGLDILLDSHTELEKDERLRRIIASYPVPLIVAWSTMDFRLTKSQAKKLGDFVPPESRGLVILFPDPYDDTIRWLNPGQEEAGKWLPSLTWALADAMGADPVREVKPLAWRGMPADGGAPFASFPAHAAALLPDAWFAGKVVLIGANQPDSDRHRTPYATVLDKQYGEMPGIQIHAHSLAQLLDGRGAAAPSLVLGIVIALVVAAIGVLVALLDAPVTVKLAGLAGLVILYWAGGFALFHAGGPLIPLVIPSVGLGAAYGIGGTFTDRRHRQQKRFIQQAFSQYVSPKIAERLSAEPDRLTLGGEKREITIIFTDIAGFTDLSERLEAEELGAVLNEYLDAMTTVAMAREGTIDKFIGDAVVVLFGAPEAQADHAERAVACALELDAAARKISARHAARGLDFGMTRIGVHSGEAVVGNFGGANRFDYTAMGDTMNTASRLEGANKYLGTHVCVSAETAARCPGRSFRPIGTVVLVGKEEGIEVLEPIADSPQITAYLATFEAMRAGDAKAPEMFAALLSDYPDDALAAMHASRLRAGESGEVIVLTSK